MATLGPELFALLNSKQHVGNRFPVVYGSGGLSEAQISEIENELGFEMPDDFSYLLQNLQDAGGVMFPWSTFSKKVYDEYIDRVTEGIEFDIEHNVCWLPRWGKRPEDLAGAVEIFREDFVTWPKLLPIHSLRFLAAEPFRSGNPVFSIVQTDIIYYGANLAHYLINEFVDHDHARHTRAKDINRIEIWSDFAEELA